MDLSTRCKVNKDLQTPTTIPNILESSSKKTGLSHEVVPAADNQLICDGRRFNLLLAT